MYLTKFFRKGTFVIASMMLVGLLNMSVNAKGHDPHDGILIHSSIQKIAVNLANLSVYDRSLGNIDAVSLSNINVDSLGAYDRTLGNVAVDLVGLSVYDRSLDNINVGSLGVNGGSLDKIALVGLDINGGSLDNVALNTLTLYSIPSL